MVIEINFVFPKRQDIGLILINAVDLYYSILINFNV